MSEALRALSDVFKNYHLGCGANLYRGYLNVGYWEQLETGGLYQNLNGTTDTYMLNYDLRHGIPAHDNSLDLVYHCHMLEHLSYQDGLAFTQECHRVLSQNGKLRIVVPDLQAWSKAYVNKDRFFLEQYQKEALDPDLYVTDGAIFMGMLHNHDHKCGYDFDTLKWMLERAGFTHIQRTLYASSAYIGNITEIEPQHPVRTMESLCVECVKA